MIEVETLTIDNKDVEIEEGITETIGKIETITITETNIKTGKEIILTINLTNLITEIEMTNKTSNQIESGVLMTIKMMVDTLRIKNFVKIKKQTILGQILMIIKRT